MIFAVNGKQWRIEGNDDELRVLVEWIQKARKEGTALAPLGGGGDLAIRVVSSRGGESER